MCFEWNTLHVFHWFSKKSTKCYGSFGINFRTLKNTPKILTWALEIHLSFDFLCKNSSITLKNRPKVTKDRWNIQDFLASDWQRPFLFVLSLGPISLNEFSKFHLKSCLFYLENIKIKSGFLREISKTLFRKRGYNYTITFFGKHYNTGQKARFWNLISDSIGGNLQIYIGN